jgi:hypothetical protein
MMHYHDEELHDAADVILRVKIKQSLELIEGENSTDMKKLRKSLMRVHDWFSPPSEWLIKEKR